MSDRALVALWLAFAAVNVVAMAAFPDFAEVPFHIVWISLMLLYGVCTWRRAQTAFALGAVSVATGVMLGIAAHGSGFPIEELIEIPLMASVFLAMVWHATRRQRALEALHAAAERELEFVRSASHELRTPITVARGHAELLRADAAGESAADLDVILDELDRLSNTADRLLTLAGHDAEPARSHCELVDLKDVIDATARRWRTAAPRAWSFEAPEAVLVAADRATLEVALDALIDNALKATKPGAGICVSAAKDPGGGAEIVVRDSGVGIAEEDIDRIFDRFWRSDAGDVEGRPGAGLGLSVVRAVADGHGGSVAARSTRGLGTSVALRLPVSSNGDRALPGDQSQPNERGT